MAKRLQDYVKYTTKELNEYIRTEGSCVRKINTNLHMAMGPFCLVDFKHVLMGHIMRSKVGFYDADLDGIVLDVKKIKVLGTTGAIRADDPSIHININADVYVFKPEEGAELTGVVKHLGPHQVGVILYRVFNVNLRVARKVDKSEISMDQEVKFRICKYNVQNVFPYIDGELLTETKADSAKKTNHVKNNNDSGIDEIIDAPEPDLLSVIKAEVPSEYKELLIENNCKNFKRCRSISGDLLTAENALPEGVKKIKKRKSSASKFSSNTEHIDEIIVSPVQKIKTEITSSDDFSPLSVKKIKKEKDETYNK